MRTLLALKALHNLDFNKIVVYILSNKDYTNISKKQNDDVHKLVQL